MNDRLAAMLAEELATPVSMDIVRFAAELAGGAATTVAVLFYGSALRTGDTDGVLDFYRLTAEPHRWGWRGVANRLLAPEVSYVEAASVAPLRAKVATLTFGQFRRAAAGGRLDTTIWARFVQPAGLVWSRDAAWRDVVVDAVGAAVTTAGRYALALGPERGEPAAFWRALFRATYAAEFRVEPPGRETAILAFAPERFDALLPLAWAAEGVTFETSGIELIPELAAGDRRRLLRAWRARRLAGRPLNIARLLKAAFTFEGAARYAAWKLERHTGVRVIVTPWRERHPILAAPGVLWRMWRGG